MTTPETPTPRTDALRMKMAQLGWPSDGEPVAMLMASHGELERELADTRQSLEFQMQLNREVIELEKRTHSELAAERALADRLADSLRQSTEGFGDRLPCEENCQCAGRLIVKANEETLAAWKAARNE